MAVRRAETERGERDERGGQVCRSETQEADGRFALLREEVLHAGGAPLFSAPACYPATVGFLGILEAIRTARRSVYLEYYRVRGGRSWRTLLSLLLDRASAGVRVLVNCDAIGSRPAVGREDVRALREAGAEVRFGYFQGGSFLARDHRKLAVIDGQTAFLGGFNLADEYFSPEKIRDLAFCLKGEGAAAAELLFLRRWNRTDTGGFRRYDDIFRPLSPAARPEQKTPSAPKGEKIPVATVFSVRTGADAGTKPLLDAENAAELSFPAFPRPCPGPKTRIPCGYLFGGGPRRPIGEKVMISLFDAAKESVTVLTPYLFPTRAVREALFRAVRRGVTVRLILPARYDILSGALLSRAWYRPLSEAGVHLRAYHGGFLHEKLVLIDRCAVLGGSYNLDRISLRMNYEDGLLLFAPTVIAPIFTHVAETMEKTRPIF